MYLSTRTRPEIPDVFILITVIKYMFIGLKTLKNDEQFYLLVIDALI